MKAPVGKSRRGFLGIAGTGAAIWPAVMGTQPALAIGRPPRPAPAGTHLFDVIRFGAVGDGRTPCTEALQRAIDACGAAGGGTVLVPPGRYATGALTLRSHVELHLSSGATLVASTRPEDFPALKGRDEGVERTIHSSLVNGLDLQNVAITGQGVLDGQGEPWWQAHQATRKMRVDANVPREAENPAGAPLKWPRPRVINLIRCKDVLIEGVTVADTPFYGVHLVYCENVVLDRVTTTQRTSASTTAIAIDSCRRVRIANSVVSKGGDGIGIKAGFNEDGRRVGIPSEDILITNCHLFGFGTTGLAIGSETAAGIRNVVISNCVIQDGANAIQIRAPRGRGGVVEQIRFCDLVMDRITYTGIKITHFFDSIRMDPTASGPIRRNMEMARSRKAPIDVGTPTFRDFSFSGLTVGKTRQLVLVEGLPERFIRGLAFENIRVDEAAGGITLTMAAEVTVSNFSVGKLQSPAVDAREVERLEVHRLKWARPFADAPAIWLENVAGAFVHGCDVADAGPGYQWLRQEQSREVTLASNAVPAPPPPKKG
jgi:polygalacturonase